MKTAALLFSILALSSLALCDVPSPSAPPDVDINEAEIVPRIAELVIKSRYEGAYDKLMTDLVALHDVPRDSKDAAWLVKWKSLAASFESEALKRAAASDARIALGLVLSRLVEVRNERVVKLVAPLLGERSESFFEGDYSILGAQEKAANALFALKVKGVSLLGAPDSPNDVRGWRRWWSETRARYGAIPEPLKKLEEEQRLLYRVK